MAAHDACIWSLAEMAAGQLDWIPGKITFSVCALARNATVHWHGWPGHFARRNKEIMYLARTKGLKKTDVFTHILPHIWIRC